MESRHPKEIPTALYWFLQWTWGILQNVIGGLMTAFIRLRHPANKQTPFHHAVVTAWNGKGSMALGGYLFLDKNSGDEIVVHEYGHTIQSLILGPFYLFVIGIPSFLWANFPPIRKRRLKRGRRYTSFYPERWASHAGEKTTGEKAFRG